MSRFNSNHPPLTIDQEVVLCRSGNYDTHYSFGYKVTKITPTGRITITKSRESGDTVLTFNKEGYQIGSGVAGYSWLSNWIDADVDGIKKKIAAKNMNTDAACALEKVNAGCVGKEWSKEALQVHAAKLRAQLDAADALIAAL